VDLRHDGGALTYGGSHALGRAGPHVADGKDAALARLERLDGARRLGARSPGDHEALPVHRNAAVEPVRVRIGADEKKDLSQGTGVRLARRPVAEHSG
jgi:hypothetical protein